MSLGKKQETFTRSLATMILYMEGFGYQSRLKEVLRTKEQAEWYHARGLGILNSNHRNGCAADIYFTKGGELFWDGTPYKMAADWWIRQSDENYEYCAGLYFSRRDVYHFSII